MESYCMHGCGSGSTEASPQFSNKLESNASSLGLYALTGIGPRKLRYSIRLQGVDEALEQIDDKGYATPYEADGRKVVKVVLNFSSKERTIKDWKVRH